jgi:hypothetical protein
VKNMPPIYPSKVFLGKCSFKGVLPIAFPIIAAKKVLIGIHIIGNITQNTPLYKLYIYIIENINTNIMHITAHINLLIYSLAFPIFKLIKNNRIPKCVIV